MRKSIILAAILLSTSALFGQEADITIEKLGPPQSAADTDVSYTITVTNLGPDPSAPITLQDNIPPGMTFVSANPSAGCTTPAVGDPGTVSCTIATLLAGDFVVYTFVFHIAPQTAPGTFFTNTATVSSPTDPTDENNSSTAVTQTPPAPQSNASIVKSGPSTAGPDTDVVYSITVTNLGPDEADLLSWTDTLPGTMTFVSFNQGSGPTMNCTTGTTINCSLPGFPASTTATFQLVGHIPAGTPAGTTFTNTATVTATNDPESNNNSSSTTLTVSSVDVGITKTGPNNADAGTPFNYTITIFNNGTDTAVNVGWTDTLPPNTTFDSLTQDNGPTASCNTPLPGTNGPVSCSFASLSSGQSAQFTLTITAGNTTAVTNRVDAGSESFDTNTSNNFSVAITTINQIADVSITKSGPPAATAGANITYTVSVSNAGPTDATNVTITDPLPANTSFVSATYTSGAAGTCSFSAPDVTCVIPTLPLGGTSTFTFVFQVSPATPNGSIISNTATAGSSTTDPDGSNNSSNTTATVAPTADLAVTKTGPATVTSGTNVTYNVTVTNNGPSNAANVTLTDTLPPNTTVVAINQTSGPAFNCSSNATAITCTIASLPAGISAGFQFTLQYTGPASGTITNTAIVSATTVDPNPANSTASAVSSANPPGDGPTLSPAALALLAAALALAGLFVVRRG